VVGKSRGTGTRPARGGVRASAPRPAARTARRADPDDPVPAHQRPEPRPGVSFAAPPISIVGAGAARPTGGRGGRDPRRGAGEDQEPGDPGRPACGPARPREARPFDVEAPPHRGREGLPARTERGGRKDRLLRPAVRLRPAGVSGRHARLQGRPPPGLGTRPIDAREDPRDPGQARPAEAVLHGARQPDHPGTACLPGPRPRLPALPAAVGLPVRPPAGPRGATRWPPGAPYLILSRVLPVRA